MTEHRGAFKFVHAFNEVCGTLPHDRVYQGFSLGFDGSVEEIWMAFSNGSALVVGDRQTPRFGNELGQFLAQSGVTYFSTVPTLLSTVTDGISTLRLLVVSGEICPSELVNRWVRPGLRMLNVYGPTEATVNTTAAECVPGRPITIGRPLSGYGIHILNEHLRPVPRGQKGELFVGGETLARGYLKQAELTAERFFTIPGTRLYRTGDLVRMNDDGELEFFGRIDGQVKIRGYRVELAEIESILLEHELIRSASVKLFERDGLQELAAFITLEGLPLTLDRAEVLSRLEARVPPYMIPGFLDVVEELPMLTSGKVDRARLPVPVSPLVRAAGNIVLPETPLESEISAVWARVFGVAQVSVEADFFLDLGGHSLVAAQMVTLLRTGAERHVTVRDAYLFPTIRKLATHLSSVAGQAKTASGPSSRTVFDSVPRATRLSTAALQLVSMYFLYGLGMIPFAIIFMRAVGWLQDRVSLANLIVSVLEVTFLTWPALLILSIAAKWLIIGRYKPGKYPLWGFQHFRLWLAGRLQGLSGVGALVGTPLLPLYFRAMGAKVGRGCTLDTALCGAWDLISIGDDTSIGSDTQFLGYRVENGMLIIGSVEIGSRCFIGIHSALGLDVRMEDDSRLDDQSLLSDGAVIGLGQSMRGSPAQPGKVPVPDGIEIRRHPVFIGVAQLLLIHLLPLLSLVPAALFLAFYFISFVYGGITAGFAALITSVPIGVVVTCLFIAALKKLILSRASPGVYLIDSLFYLRKWLSDGIMRSSRGILLPLYTTLYFPPWLRLLGAKIGPRAELSTVWNFAPELVDVGEESFFADGSIIGGKRFFRGRFEIGINRIGRRSFVGNSAILPVGKGLGDRCLLGVQSIPPAETKCTADGTEWLGSPAFALPHRPKVGNFDDTVTFRPTRKLYFQRAIIDGLRILIPGYIGLSVAVLGALALYFSYTRLGLAAMFLLAPPVGFALALYATSIVVGIKKVVMGTFKPVIKPLWSKYVWLNEMVNGAFESVMAPAISPFLGTPFIAPFLRLMGCRIGKHCYIETTLFSEFDLVDVGDYVALNAGVVPQTHLFEDRVMKSSYLKIGDECSVGNMAVILYDSEMQKGAWLGPLSLLMKGERLAPCSRSHGIPTVQAPEPVPQSPEVVARGLRRDLSPEVAVSADSVDAG